MAVSPNFRLTVGQLVSASIGVWLRNIVPFLFLGTLVLGPWIALEFWMPEARLERNTLQLVMAGAFVLQMVLTYVLTGAITFGVVMQLRGSPAGLGDCIGKGLGSLWRVLGTGVVVGVRILLFSLLLVVPGIIESVRLFVVLPVAVMEQKVGNAAARRSVELVRGSGAPLFWSWVLAGILSGLIGFVMVFLVVALDPEFRGESPWLTVGITVPINTFMSTMMAVAYFLLRKGKENVDAKEIAKVFD